MFSLQSLMVSPRDSSPFLLGTVEMPSGRARHAHGLLSFLSFLSCLPSLSDSSCEPWAAEVCSDSPADFGSEIGRASARPLPLSSFTSCTFKSSTSPKQSPNSKASSTGSGGLGRMAVSGIGVGRKSTACPGDREPNVAKSLVAIRSCLYLAVCLEKLPKTELPL